jgi:DNA modification methylase
MDCLEGMKEIEDNSIDLVLTDPPYNCSISKISFADKYYESLDEEWDKGFKIDFFPIVAKKVRDGGSILIYCSHHLLGEYLNNIPEGLKLRQIIHWRKEGVVPSICNRLYAWSIEYILWFTKGKNYTFNKKEWQNYTDVIVTKLKDKEQKKQLHPTQKHLSVMRRLIKVHSKENDIVLDCFMGSGTTAMACKMLNRKYIGFEISPEYCKIANKRLSQEVLILEKTEGKE